MDLIFFFFKCVSGKIVAKTKVVRETAKGPRSEAKD